MIAGFRFVVADAEKTGFDTEVRVLKSHDAAATGACAKDRCAIQ